MFEINLSSLSLLTTYVRGYFYTVTKNKLNIRVYYILIYSNKELAKKFLLSRQTVDRMIKVYNLLKKYPLLLKSNIYSNNMADYAKRICDYISSKEELHTKY